MDCYNAAWIYQHCNGVWLLQYGHIPEHERHGSMHGILPSRALCFKGAHDHSGRPVCTPNSAVRCRFCLLAKLLLIMLPSPTNLHQTHPSATQLSYSRSRVPVCLRVLHVPEHVPCQPYPCHCYFPSLPTRPLLLSFFRYIKPGCHLPISGSV